VSDLPSLDAVVREAAAALPGIAATSASDGAVAWSASGHPFAVLGPDRIELRLDPLVAAAALRTPDTHRSDRGPDWIAFGPAPMDEHAVDRVVAWFAHAARRAARGS
jgi:2,4-dienoyl-CoA reductase-like NADH-dependent reductase (Old Yellow Enzyme family)